MVQLTSADEGIDIFNFSDGRVIAVGNQALDRIKEAVNVDDRSGIAEFRFEITEPPFPVFVGDSHVGVARTETAAANETKLLLSSKCVYQTT